MLELNTPNTNLLVGNFELNVRLSELNINLSTNSLLKLLHQLRWVASFGGFSGINRRIIDPRFDYERSASTPDSFLVKIASNGIDSGIVECLRSHLINSFDKSLNGIISLTPKDLAGHAPKTLHRPLPSLDQDTEFYPALCEPLPFQIEQDYSGESRSIVFSIYFSAVPDQRRIENLSVAVRAWGDLIESGAFSMPDDYPDERLSIFGDISEPGNQILEITIDRYDANSSGLNPLLNILAHDHKLHGGVARVEIT